MVRVISIANQKGGCGKTTTSINLAAALSFLQKKVLLIDLDPQGHSTCGLGVKAETLDKTVYNLFKEDLSTTPIAELICPVEAGLDLIPAYVVLSAIEEELATAQGKENKLVGRLSELSSRRYDFILMDCPPNLGLLTYNALRASDEILIPIEPSFFSLHGLAKIFETTNWIRKTTGKTLQLHALLTRYEKRTRLTQEVQEEVGRYFQDQVFSHPIRENVKLREAAAAGKSIVQFDRNSTGFQDYMNLAIEVIERGMIKRTIFKDSVPPIATENEVAKEEKNETPKTFEIPSAETILDAIEKGTQIQDDEVSEDAHTSDQNANTSIAVQETTPFPVTESELVEKAEINEETSESQLATLESDRQATQSPIGTKILEDRDVLAPYPVLGGILFSYQNPEAKEVLIAGDFNQWVGELMIMLDESSATWHKIIAMPAGIHRYKFLVNGEWTIDPHNEWMEPTPYGGVNSVLEVKPL